MRRFITVIALSVLWVQLSMAQDQYYLFPSFQKGHFVFNDNTEAEAMVNFDANRQKILYLDGETLMEMNGISRIKALRVEDRAFVVKDGRLHEVFDLESGPVLVNWRFRRINKGSKGAMGIPTQGKVEALRIYPFDLNSVDAGVDSPVQGTYLVEIWEKENDNIYCFAVGDEECKIRSIKDIRRLFPTVSDDIKSFVKSERLTMARIEDTFRIIEHIRSVVK